MKLVKSEIMTIFSEKLNCNCRIRFVYFAAQYLTKKYD